jgi:putative ABC transport system substrate-binding protein
MRRREFIVLVGGVAVSPPAVFAQQATKPPLVAVLSRYSPFPIDALKEALRELGRVDGQSIQMQVRSADGNTARLPELAQELVRLKPDVLVAGNDQVAMAFKKLTTTIPIVGAQLIDPIGLGMIENLARPAGNVTGMLFTLEGMPGKQLQLLREMKPGLSRVAVIVVASEELSKMLLQGAEAAATLLGITLIQIEIRTRNDWDAAFKTMRQAHVEAVLDLPSALLYTERRNFAAELLAARLPSVSSVRIMPATGCLMSYGPAPVANWRRVAYFVDEILKGTKPADLPVEQPTKFELVINQKTATSLGLTIPQSIVLRADEVIE